MMRNALPGLLVFLSILASAPGNTARASEDECVPLPAHEEKILRHGHQHWSDERLRVYGALKSGVRIPPGWIPVGADRIADGCAFFPRRQATLFVNPPYWQVELIESAEAGLTLQLLHLKTTPREDLVYWRQMVVETYRDVASLFPLGLKPDQRLPHVILVTSGMAGDGTKLSARLFPAPGPNLTNLFYNPGDGRGRDLFIHTTTHLFNKRRPRAETTPDEDGLSTIEFREMVATWAEIAFNPDDSYVRDRVDFLLRQHVALTDDDPDSQPSSGSIEKLGSMRGPFGLPPNAPEGHAAREYAHYYLSPLIMLAIDGLMAEQGQAASVHTILRDIHAGNRSGLIAALGRVLPLQLQQIRNWMHGTEPVPADLIEAGLTRLRDRTVRIAQ